MDADSERREIKRGRHRVRLLLVGTVLTFALAEAFLREHPGDPAVSVSTGSR
ncbi:hypothetical protein ACFYON_11460 [Micromonospora sp. NPDC005686]|uniref:hypothetical protein n=1 Tax=unclassified Micromonospora TaxID=2617518 RepID=UPI0033B3631C